MGGSNEFVECFCGGVVAEGGSGAVARDFPISNGRGASINQSHPNNGGTNPPPTLP